ncbi:MAG TPA: 3-methyl-2-oxobutanoate dehydrogenase subunit VorB [Candidatus Hypogeohydataceae bacterium YC41]
MKSSNNKKQLLTGNEAAAEAAILAGCRYYYGYPITPQNELVNHMAIRMPQVGGTFLQAESEIAAIYMAYGSAAAGARVMTSSSSPGISLMQEGISYLAGSELPCVIVNMQRGGPGLGDISPSQADYFQAVKGGGHGDYRTIVLAPASVQEIADLVYDAFDLADRYRNPVMLLGDAQLGQMMEPVELKKIPRTQQTPRWAVTGAEGRARNIIKSFYPVKGELEAFNIRLQRKYKVVEQKEVRYEEVNTERAEIILVAYGTCARICKEALRRISGTGLQIGLLRPISLWPFPKEPLRRLAKKAKAFCVVEMSSGQMLEDVKLAVLNRCPVHFYGRMGGGVPSSKEVIKKVLNILAPEESTLELEMSEISQELGKGLYFSTIP